MAGRFGGIPLEEAEETVATQPAAVPEAAVAPKAAPAAKAVAEPAPAAQPTSPVANPESGGRFGGIPAEDAQVQQPIPEPVEVLERLLPQPDKPGPTPELSLEEQAAELSARRSATTANREIDESNPMLAGLERRLTLAGDSATFGVGQKMQGIIARLQGEDPEVAEKEWKYYIEELRKEVPESLIWELVGGLFTPGGPAKGVVKAAGSGAAQSAADNEMRNLPSETGQGAIASGIGGAAIGGALSAGGAVIANRKVPEVGPVTGVREPAGLGFREAASKDFAATKEAKKAALEKVIQDGNITFKDNAGPRLEYNVRSNIEADLAALPENKGLATNINEQVTPGAWDILKPETGVLAEAAGKYPQEMSLRELDNFMRRLSRVKPQGAADEVAVKAIKNRVMKYADIAEVNTLTGVPKAVIDGDPKAIKEWQAANKDMSGYLSIQQGTDGAKRLLRNVIDNQDLTGMDLARMTFGATRIAEGVKATGMVDTLETVFGRDSDVFRAYQEGIMAVLAEGEPKAIAKRVSRFLDDNQELAASIFDPKQLNKLEDLRSKSAAVTIARASKRPGIGGGMSTTTQSILAYALGGPWAAGAVVASEGAAKVFGRDKALNQAIRDGLENSVGTTSRQFGEPTGEALMPGVVSARDAVIQNLQGEN